MTEQQQPESTERVEWGVMCDHDRSASRASEQVARDEVALSSDDPCHPRLVRRTVTTYKTVVGPWEEVNDE